MINLSKFILYEYLVRSSQFILAILSVWTGSLHAQSDFDLTQRLFNEALYNPAATGNHFTTSIFLQGRTQWVGLEGAPTTQAVSFDTYAEPIRSAFGFSITGDQIGFTNSNNARLAYSYYFAVTNRSFLSLGISASLLNRSMSANGALVDDLSDQELYYWNTSEYSQDFDFGVEYKGPIKAGIAIRHLGTLPSSNHFPPLSRNVWAYASSRFNMAGISAEPAVSYMYRNKISRYEAGALFYFMKTNRAFEFCDRFWMGGMVRFHGQFALLAGATVSKKMRVGYSFDYGTGDLALISKYGTHEIFLAWQFNRIFYKDKLCPAYRNARYDTKGKKKFMEKIRDHFSM